MSPEDTANAAWDRPLEVLFEVPGLPDFPLPGSLARHHGGSFGFPRERLFANFVASIDGVVALATNAESGHIISRGNEADRFVMGLLRASADAVMIGAGTFRKATGHLWQAGAIYPAGAAHFVEMRRRLGLRDDPTLVIVTASGLIDGAQPAVRDAIIVTIPAGETTLRARVPPTARILVLDGPTICLAEVV
ncbi:MAG: dihydrofolate reductase family protein, partial [Myxococcota bacterium]|nr:dihydrofolate reductase family protein [Myxococcota bacterium]